MSATSMYAVAMLLEMAGLFAIWNWSRRFRSVGWMISGSAILFALAGVLVWALDPVEARFYAAAFAVYLLSGLAWAWSMEALRPADWRFGECFVALLAAGLFGVAGPIP